jgi:hypothetical protein
MIRSKMKTLCKKQHKEVDEAINDKILPEAPYGYLPPSTIAHLYNQVKYNNIGSKSSASSGLPSTNNSSNTNTANSSSTAPATSSMHQDSELNIATSSLAPRKGEDWMGLIAIATADNPSTSSKDVSNQQHQAGGFKDITSPPEQAYAPYDENVLGNSVVTILNRFSTSSSSSSSAPPATPSNAAKDLVESDQYMKICKNVVKEICKSTISSVSMLAPRREPGIFPPKLDEAPPFAKQGLLLQKKIWQENIINQKNSFKEHLKEYIACAIQAYQYNEVKQAPVAPTDTYSTKKRGTHSLTYSLTHLTTYSLTHSVADLDDNR